jgi:hypothetical protein
MAFQIERTAAVRNHAPSGWTVIVSGGRVGPVFRTRKEAQAWAVAMGY